MYLQFYVCMYVYLPSLQKKLLQLSAYAGRNLTAGAPFTNMD